VTKGKYGVVVVYVYVLLLSVVLLLLLLIADRKATRNAQCIIDRVRYILKKKKKQGRLIENEPSLSITRQSQT
jgi:uncharacterized membrane protein